MTRGYIGLAMCALIAVAAFLSLPSCGHDQKLVSLQVTPVSPGFTFPTPNPGATGQYHAIGTYIHPPVTKDVTSQANWSVDDGVVSINAGLVTTNGSCGSADVIATMPEGTGGASNIVIAYSFVTVEDLSDPHCPGGSATNGELQVAVTGDGTVISQPGGINCTPDCTALFPTVDSPITLTATPGGTSTSVNWSSNCAVGSNPNQCAVPLVGGNIATVSATFN